MNMISRSADALKITSKNYTYSCSSWLSSISITLGCDIGDLFVVKFELWVSLSSPKLVILESFLLFIVSWLSSAGGLVVVMRLLEWVKDVGGIILLSPLSTFFIPATCVFLHFLSVRFGFVECSNDTFYMIVVIILFHFKQSKSTTHPTFES